MRVLASRALVVPFLVSLVLVASPGPVAQIAAAGVNVLLGKPVVACPQGSYGGTVCGAVNDGDDATRYIASADGDWWIVIDAGALVTVKDYRVVGPTHVGGGLCNEGGAKTIAGYTSNPTVLNADPSMVFHVHTVSVPCWDGTPIGTVVNGALPRPFTARYFLISGHSFFYGGWNEFALYESPPLVPPASDNVLLDRPVVSCPAGNYATDFGTGNCGDVNDGDDVTRYTAAADGLWSVVIDAGSDVPVKNFHVAGPTPIPGGCSQGNAKISGYSGPPFTVGGPTMVFSYDLPNQCWAGVTLDGTLPLAYTARYFMISGVSFFYGGWNEFALVRVVATNQSPSVAMPSQVTSLLHDGFTASGTFADPDVGQSWTATVDYGDGAGVQPLPLTTDKRFALSHRYTKVGEYSVLVTVTDSAGAASGGVTFVDIVPKRLVLYVHGTTGRATDPVDDFASLLRNLPANNDVVPYVYFEDRSLAPLAGIGVFTCDGRRALPADFDASRFTFTPDEPDPWPGTCDSNDDLELNAALLDSDLTKRAPDYDAIVIVSNSGGGALVRGYLAYASAKPSPSLSKLETAVFLEGVQGGTYLAALYQGANSVSAALPGQSILRDLVLDASKVFLVHDPRRPVFNDVLPQSDYQRFVARAAAIPDGVNYVNVPGDISLRFSIDFLFSNIDLGSVSVGDFVMLPGSDDPTALPVLGAGRFLPDVIGRGSSSTQLLLTNEIPVVIDGMSLDPGSPAFGVRLNEGIQRALADPANHLHLELDQMCVRVPAPDGGTTVKRVSRALIDAIGALDLSNDADGVRLGYGNAHRVPCP